MATFSTDRLRPGMVVSTEILNMDGHLIMPAGTELTENRIETLLAWGIIEIDIEDGTENATEEDAELSEDIQQFMQTLKPRFKFCDTQSPVVTELMQICAERLAIKQAKQKST